MRFLALPSLRARRSPVRRGRTAVAFVGVLALVMIFGAYTLIDIVLRARPGSLIVFTKAGLLMTIASLPSIGVVWYLDRWERESRWLMAAALLWGAIASTGLAAGVNSYGDQVVGRLFTDLPLVVDLSQRVGGTTADVGYLVVSWFIAPGVEEFCKMQVIIALLWLARREFNGVRDGIVYGALVGIGFNIVEGAIAVVHGYTASGDPAIAPYSAQLATRFALFGLSGHLAYSALCGAGLGLARQTNHLWLQRLAPWGGFILAYHAHVIGNVLETQLLTVIPQALTGEVYASLAEYPVGLLWFSAAVSTLAIEFFALVLLGVAMYQSGAWERGILIEGMSDELPVVVTPAELADVVNRSWLPSRPLAHRAPNDRRFRARAQHELALRKWELRFAGRNPNADPDVQSLRESLRATAG